MDWLNTTLHLSADAYAVVVICIICAIGLSLGKMHIRNISLGVTFVFFMGICAGHFGLHVNHDMLVYAENSGLILFVYALGLQVGPGFVSSFRQGGTQLNLLALGVVVLGTLMAVICHYTTGVSMPDMMGVLCGATTNTPALGAAQQTLTQMGQSAAAPSLALGCAVTYPLGVVGVILAYMLIRPIFRRFGRTVGKEEGDEERPYIVSFYVRNPAVFGKPLKAIAEMNDNKFVMSRLWRNERVILPDAETKLEEDDRILVITTKKCVEQLTIFFGERDTTDWNKKNIDWDAIDSRLVSQRIVITRHEINGRKLESLHLRNRFGISVSRVDRSEIQLVATPDLVLRMGDRLTVVGEEGAIKRVAAELGNAVLHLEEPNLVSIFVGIVLGLALGAIPFAVPGISVPVKLGIAGGPIVVGLLVGAYGPRFHMITYTTSSANRMLRALGLTIYLACLGLDAGPRFFDTVMQPEGALWIGLGFLITVIPVVIMALICLKTSSLDLPTTSGMLCGSMANPMALNYVNDSSGNDRASVAYTTVYPLCMFVRVIIAQLLLMELM